MAPPKNYIFNTKRGKKALSRRFKWLHKYSEKDLKILLSKKIHYKFNYKKIKDRENYDCATYNGLLNIISRLHKIPQSR